MGTPNSTFLCASLGTSAVTFCGQLVNLRQEDPEAVAGRLSEEQVLNPQLTLIPQLWPSFLPRQASIGSQPCREGHRKQRRFRCRKSSEALLFLQAFLKQQREQAWKKRQRCRWECKQAKREMGFSLLWGWTARRRISLKPLEFQSRGGGGWEGLNQTQSQIWEPEAWSWTWHSECPWSFSGDEGTSGTGIWRRRKGHDADPP